MRRKAYYLPIPCRNFQTGLLKLAPPLYSSFFLNKCQVKKRKHIKYSSLENKLRTQDKDSHPHAKDRNTAVILRPQHKHGKIGLSDEELQDKNKQKTCLLCLFKYESL